jgi:hypothetical protein
MKLQISLQHHQLNLEKSYFEVLYTLLVFLSTQSLDLTIQSEVVVVEVKMHEIVLEIPTQKGSAWQNFELQNHENTAIALHPNWGGLCPLGI